MSGKIDEQTLALFLVDPARVKNKKKRTQAQEFLESHTISALAKALKDGKQRVDLTWCIQAYLELFYDERAKISDQLTIIKEFRELILLGAIQDPALAEFVTRAVAQTEQKKETAMKDPFTKPRLVKGDEFTSLHETSARSKRAKEA